MNMSQHARYVACIPPAAILDDGSAATVEIDTIGADYLEVVVTLGATDIAMTALKLQHSDTTGTGFADVTGATFDGGLNTEGVALSLPSATDDNQVCVFRVDLLGKKRFFEIVATNGDGTAGGFISAVARLSKNGGPIISDTDYANGGVCVA